MEINMLMVSENSGIRCIKFSLIFFTVILVATGISLIIVGSTIDQIFDEFFNFLGNLYFSPATFVTSVGFTLFGIACIGCYGAIKESVCITTIFGILLGVTAFLQACTGMANNVIIPLISSETANNLNRTMLSYNFDESSKNTMDYLQQELHCCGMYGPKDWMLPIYGEEVPRSCCAHFSEFDKCNMPYNFGCHTVLKAILSDSCKILSVSAYLLAFTQIFGMLFAFYLAKMLREQKLARDYRRWAIRNQLLNNMASDPYFNSPHAFSDIPEKK